MSDLIERLKSQASQEPIASLLGLKLIELTPGFARVSMKMKPEYLNFNGIVFGPIIAAVADQAFAYAGNSVLTPNVASQFNIHYLASATEKDELFGECTVLKKGKRVCIMEMKVTNQEGKLIAIGTGTTIPLVERSASQA